jgi:hypothetical protein
VIHNQTIRILRVEGVITAGRAFRFVFVAQPKA